MIRETYHFNQEKRKTCICLQVTVLAWTHPCKHCWQNSRPLCWYIKAETHTHIPLFPPLCHPSPNLLRAYHSTNRKTLQNCNSNEIPEVIRLGRICVHAHVSVSIWISRTFFKEISQMSSVTTMWFASPSLREHSPDSFPMKLNLETLFQWAPTSCQLLLGIP